MFIKLYFSGILDFRAIPRHRIGRVLIDTPAYRAQLRVGDRVLAVNDVSMDDLPHDRIVDLIRQSGQRLQLLERVLSTVYNIILLVKHIKTCKRPSQYFVGRLN